MSEKKKQDKNYQEVFDPILEMLKKELERMNALENEMRSRMSEICGDPDNRTRRSGSSPLTFLSGMYENLITLSGSRLATIKDMTNVNKIISDFELKSGKDTDEANKYALLAAQILAKINNSNYSVATELNTEDELEELDRVADEAAKRSGFIPESEDSDQMYVVNKADGSIYLVNKNYDIIDTFVDEEERFVIKKNKKGSIISAMDKTTGEKIEVVEYADS